MCSLPTWAFQVRGSPYILNILILFRNLFEILNKYILNISRPTRNFSGPPVFSKLFPVPYRVPETIPVFSPIKSQSLQNFSGVLYSCSYHSTTQQIFHP